MPVADPSEQAVASAHESAVPGSGRKLASSVALRIQQDIADSGWNVGSVIGTEPVLLDRYGVSRAVFREAVRLVEHLGIATMRRGPHGGLTVAGPRLDMVIDAVTVYLLHADVSLEQLLEARLAVEATIAELASQRASEDDVHRLRELVDDKSDETFQTYEGYLRLHAVFAEIARNPAAELFAQVFGELVGRFTTPKGDSEDARRLSTKAHRALVEAITEGNAGLARHRMTQHLDAMASWFTPEERSDTLLSTFGANGADSDQTVKLGEQLARRVLTEVISLGWPVGTVIGSEAALMERYGVSRAVLREAVRLLEHHRIAAMRRGPGGGLMSTKPDSEAVTNAVSTFLEFGGIRSEQLVEMRRGLELFSVQLAAERATPPGVARLRDAHDSVASQSFSPDQHEDFHIAVAELTGNPAIELFTRVLNRLTSMHSDEARRRSDAEGPQLRASVQRAHAAIIDAISSGDAVLARHRMQRHLDAVAPWLS